MVLAASKLEKLTSRTGFFFPITIRRSMFFFFLYFDLLLSSLH